MTLAQYVKWNPKTRKAQRGALTRVAEYVGVKNASTVWHWLTGDFPMTIETKRKVQDMIHARVPLFARRRKPSGNKPLGKIR